MVVIKYTYSVEVAASVQRESKEFLEEAVTFVNFVKPGLLHTLALQRKEYNTEIQTEFPIHQQAPKIDDLPYHNRKVENYYGKDASLMEKVKTVEAASRSKILKPTK